MLRSCLVSSLFWLLLLRLDCRLLQAIEKKEKLSIAASKIDIYSLKESFPPRYSTCPFRNSPSSHFKLCFECGLLVCQTCMQTLMTCLHIMYSTRTSPIPQQLSQASGSEKSRFYL